MTEVTLHVPVLERGDESQQAQIACVLPAKYSPNLLQNFSKDGYQGS